MLMQGIPAMALSLDDYSSTTMAGYSSSAAFAVALSKVSPLLVAVVAASSQDRACNVRTTLGGTWPVQAWPPKADMLFPMAIA